MKFLTSMHSASMLLLSLAVSHCGSQPATKKGAPISAAEQLNEGDDEALPKPIPKAVPSVNKNALPAMATTTTNASGTSSTPLASTNSTSLPATTSPADDQIVAYLQTPAGLQQLYSIFSNPQIAAKISQLGLPTNQPLNAGQLNTAMQIPDVAKLLKEKVGASVPTGASGGGNGNFNFGSLSSLLGGLGGLNNLNAGFDFSKLFGGQTNSNSGVSVKK